MLGPDAESKMEIYILHTLENLFPPLVLQIANPGWSQPSFRIPRLPFFFRQRRRSLFWKGMDRERKRPPSDSSLHGEASKRWKGAEETQAFLASSFCLFPLLLIYCFLKTKKQSQKKNKIPAHCGRAVLLQEGREGFPGLKRGQTHVPERVWQL